ncbi:MAG TPA: hypothetical protein VNI78_06765 [Vicinamibacterales bacterium]|nr:hypothetical protein [Vicinamibacterales bacterium]
MPASPDAGALVAIAALVAALALGAVRNTRALARLEPRPGR